MLVWTEFWHVWMNFELHVEVYSLHSLDLSYGLVLTIWIYLGKTAFSWDYESNWCFYGLAGFIFITGWIFTYMHLPGSSARWCVENWPTVSRLWLSTSCDCHAGLWLWRFTSWYCHVRLWHLTTTCWTVSGVRPSSRRTYIWKWKTNQIFSRKGRVFCC